MTGSKRWACVAFLLALALLTQVPHRAADPWAPVPDMPEWARLPECQ